MWKNFFYIVVFDFNVTYPTNPEHMPEKHLRACDVTSSPTRTGRNIEGWRPSTTLRKVARILTNLRVLKGLRMLRYSMPYEATILSLDVDHEPLLSKNMMTTAMGLSGLATASGVYCETCFRIDLYTCHCTSISWKLYRMSHEYGSLFHVGIILVTYWTVGIAVHVSDNTSINVHFLVIWLWWFAKISIAFQEI